MGRLKGIFSDYGVISKMLLLVGISCCVTVLALIFLILFSNGNSNNIDSIKLMQLVQSVGMFVLPPFVFAYFCSNKPIAFLHFDRKTNWIHILLVVFFMVLIIPGINLLTSLNQQLVLPRMFEGVEAWMKSSEEQMAKLTEQLLNVHTLTSLVFNVLLVAMIPALGEELFFRGAVQGIFRQKMNVKIAIWLTAILFSAIHMQFYGFIPRMLLGAFFGYLLFWSGNLWLPIVAHFTNNGIAIIFYYLKYNGYKVQDIDTIGTGSSLWLGGLSIAVGILGFFLLRNRIRKSLDIAVGS
ncbi:MAG TPA: type II CAAX endopeptidase family protein [Paludibacter sp.]|nr:type II CAAX endopeptidase family protein [Paludibacter sp.]